MTEEEKQQCYHIAEKLKRRIIINIIGPSYNIQELQAILNDIDNFTERVLEDIK